MFTLIASQFVLNPKLLIDFDMQIIEPTHHVLVVIVKSKLAERVHSVLMRVFLFFIG